MSNIDFHGKTSFTCTCTHGGGGHMVACDFFVPTKEQYLAVCAERDRAREALKAIHGSLEALTDPVNGKPYWLK